ncbi:hypothetical protein MMC29_003977 [Sticta canariensis]|nr:hypothetical protein [Sticta canariensis]
MAQLGSPLPSASLDQTRLAGHLGHLTAHEESQFQAFKVLCQEQGYYKPTDGKTAASHDDGTLVRYLRARKFVPQDAFVQFKDTEIWRRENKLDELYEKIDINDYQEARSVYPQWTGRRDKRGMPVYLYEVSKLNSKKMVAYASATSKSSVNGPAPSKMLRLFALYENLTRFVTPLCSAVPGRPNPETPVDQSNNIVDISKVGLKQFWNLRSHMQDASTLATAHYPETLDRIFIIGAPSFFPTVWGWIKKWFDPITTSKIFILSANEVLPTLTAYIDIANIPKKFGGDLDFESGMTPVLDPAVRAVLNLSSESTDAERLFLTAPVRWIDGPDGDLVALGVGSLNGVQRRETVATMHAHAAQNAFQPPGTPGLQYHSEFFMTQPSAVQNSALQDQVVQDSNGQKQAPQIPATQNSVVENGASQDFANPPTSTNKEIESTQQVPMTARDGNILPPIGHETSGYATPPSDPSELKKL